MNIKRTAIFGNAIMPYYTMAGIFAHLGKLYHRKPVNILEPKPFNEFDEQAITNAEKTPSS